MLHESGDRFPALSHRRSVSTPSLEAVDRLLAPLLARFREGVGIAIHCRAGIGRSSLLCASLLVKDGWTDGDAFQAIQQARGFPVPDTPEQREWVASYARWLNKK